jgi:hypothetical protein
MLILGGSAPTGPANDVWQTGLVPVPITVSIVPQSPVVINGTSTTYNIILSAAPYGISGIEYQICQNNTANGQITSFTTPPWAGLANSVQTHGYVRFAAVDLTGTSGTTNITLGSFSILNTQPGITTFSYGSQCAEQLIIPSIQDRIGGSYMVKYIPENFTVMTDRLPFPRPQPLGGFFGAPKDPNHDGLYEDLDGNGFVTMNDVVVMFTNLDDITAGTYGLVSYYDFDGSGDIGFNDVVTLYNEIRVQV